ncbi:MAG: CPBP family glutamic-type intramembrane protease [Candidatus Dormibacteria bacterium]
MTENAIEGHQRESRHTSGPLPGRNQHNAADMDSPATGLMARIRRPLRGDVSWNWVDVALFLVLAFLAVSVVGFFAVAGIPRLLAIFSFSDEARQAYASLLEEATFYATAIAVLLVVLRSRHGAGTGALGWRRVRWFWIPAAVVGGLVSFKVVDVAATWIQQLFPGAQNGQIPAVQQSFGHLLVVGLLVVSIIAPIAEETVFRGFIYAWMRRHLNVPFSAVLSGAFFALLHFQPIIFVPLLLLGVVLALIYEYSGSIVPGIIVHGVFNAIEIALILH